MKSLLNKAEVKRRVLDVARASRVTPFNRVSSKFMLELEEKVFQIIKRSVNQHPSKGKTIDQVI